jgi:SNF2 family DNA or RNA helicase
MNSDAASLDANCPKTELMTPPVSHQTNENQGNNQQNRMDEPEKAAEMPETMGDLKAGTKQVEVIDLEDDEVVAQIYAKPVEDKIAFGMIRTRLIDVVAKLHPSRHRKVGVTHVLARIDRKRVMHAGLLKTPEKWHVFEPQFDDAPFGRVDDHVVAALVPLVSPKDGTRTITQIKAYIPISATMSNVAPVYLIVYGPREHAFAVGKVLTRASISLTSPTVGGPFGPDNYLNPHLISIGGNAHTRSVSTQPVMNPDRGQIDELYQSLRSGEDLSETEPSQLCVTPLYPHQKQALTFMLERESDPATRDSALNIWTQTCDFSKSPPRMIWMCVLNNQPKKEGSPEEVRGGIVADDMGLGKTLMIISLILSDLRNTPRTQQRWSYWTAEAVPAEVVGDSTDESHSPNQSNDQASQRSQPKSQPIEVINLDSDSDIDVLPVSHGPIDHPDVPTIPGADLIPMLPHQAPRPATLHWTQIIPHIAAGTFPDSSDSRAAIAHILAQTINLAPPHIAPSLRLLSSHFTSNVAVPDIVQLARRIVTLLNPAPLILPMVQSHSNQTPHMYAPQIYTQRATVGTMSQTTMNSAPTVAYLPKPYLATMPTQKKKKLVAVRPPPTIASLATLIVCPLSTVTTWEEQIIDHTANGSLKVYVYHGPNRTQDLQELANNDVVLTTYNMLGTESSRESKTMQDTDASGKAKRPWYSPLHSIRWSRVVLDEAHVIKEPSTQQSRGACHLVALKRWCLTGTPIQNRLDDLYALLKFLHLDPFTEKSVWQESFTRLLKSGNVIGIQRLQTLLKIITLRRTKQSTIKGKPIVSLPPRVDSVVGIDLTPEERDLYRTADKYAADVFKALVESNAVMRNYIHVLEMALRLRQLATHPALCDKEQLKFQTILQQVQASGGMDLIDDAEFSPASCLTQWALMSEAEQATCCSCEGDVTEPGNDDVTLQGQIPVFSRCHHLYCRECWQDAIKSKSFQCHECTKLLRAGDFLELTFSSAKEYPGHETMHVKPDVKPKLEQDSDQPRFSKESESAKITALIADLRQAHKEAASAGETIPKSIIFSQWTNMLDIIGIHLKKNGIKFVRLDGSMARLDRKVSIEKLRKDEKVLVMLVSLKAGGVGLNLTMANRAYLFEPYWNPAVENQAIDRVHRLGQTKPVTTVRYIVRDSIEERILDMQRKKMTLANMALQQTTDEDDRKGKKRKRAANKEEEMVKKLSELKNLFSSRG